MTMVCLVLADSGPSPQLQEISLTHSASPVHLCWAFGYKQTHASHGARCTFDHLHPSVDTSQQVLAYQIVTSSFCYFCCSFSINNTSKCSILNRNKNILLVCFISKNVSNCLQIIITQHCSNIWGQ